MNLEEMFKEVYSPEWIRNLIDGELELINGIWVEDDRFYEAIDELSKELEETADEEIKQGLKEAVIEYWPNEWSKYPEEVQEKLMDIFIDALVVEAVRIAFNDIYGRTYFDIDSVWEEFSFSFYEVFEEYGIEEVN